MTAVIQAIREAELIQRTGTICEITGTVIYSHGPDAVIGELCCIQLRHANLHEEQEMLAEVIGLRDGRVTLMPYGPVTDVAIGCVVVAKGVSASVQVSEQLLGRVIDGFGNPLDGLPSPLGGELRPLKAKPLNPMSRPRINTVLETGIKSIDTLLSIGQGQRVGIFAGSGVGKSTLLGMITRHITADINVIALIGERGREVKDFIEKNLGESGLKRSIVVVATSDQPALSRIRAAYVAIAIAEFFRDAGKNVLLTMDSITRLAMARREVGLAAGEPPTARGYTPSVFAELPGLCERCGTSSSGGSITALLTVLVEGDDLNEPISDALRSILDGHIVLSRHIAHRGQYPAIDILKSASRLMPDLANEEELALAIKAVQVISTLEKNRQLVDMGAYEHGSNIQLDQALRLQDKLMSFLRQKDIVPSRKIALQELREVLNHE